MSPATLAAGAAAALAPFALAELVATRRPGAGRKRPAPGLLRATARALSWLGRRLGVAPAPEDLARRLAAAGVSASVRPAEVMAVKTGTALVALLAGAAPALALPGRLGPVVLLALPLGAAHAPDAWLLSRARRRGRVMAGEVADVLDLLGVCVQAGRAPTAALAEVGRRHRGLLGRELRGAAREIGLGRPRTLVLSELADRCPIEEVASLVAALRRADRHGAPLAPALQALATDARAARGRAVRERAAKAAPKIQLVVALLLVPAVMLLVGAALAAAFGVA